MMKRKIMTKQTWNIPPDKRVRVSMTRQNRKAENGEKIAGRHAGGESRFPASGRKRSPFPHLQKIRLLPGRRHTTSENTIMKFFSAACILGICCLLSGAQKSAENSSTLFDPPKQRFLETENNNLSNPTAYAGSVSLKQKNIGSFKMAFQLRLLPLVRSDFPSGQTEEQGFRRTMDYVPSVDAVLDNIVPGYVKGMIFGGLVESFCSEQNARMTAMQTANDNASDMLKKLSLSYNQARQTAITQEITEIVGGSGLFTQS